jgi:hypothetical protein
MPAVFIAQTTLQQWADLGKVRLEDTTLHLLKEQRSVVLKAAVRFTKLIVGDNDPFGLLGKVKSTEQLKALKAEHYMDSVICGEIAYQVVEGFLGDLQASKEDAPAAPKAAPAPASATSSGEPLLPARPVEPGERTEEISDAEALSRLFLDTVR